MIAVFSSDQYFEIIFESLNNHRIKVDFLVTESEKPSGRGRVMTKNAAHKTAQSVGLTVETFDKLDDKSLAKLKKLIDDNKTKLGFVFSYGKIIPEEFINLFELGIINVHFSILPKYRGAAPLQGALLNADKKTGLTFFLIDKDLDTGKLLQQIEFDIYDDDDFESIKDRAPTITAENLPALITGYINGDIKPYEQNSGGVSYVGEIKKSDGLITSEDSAQTALNKIRAFSVWPKAYFILEGKRVIVHKATIDNERLEITLIQVEGKGPVSFDDFKRGYPRLLTLLPDFVNIG